VRLLGRAFLDFVGYLGQVASLSGEVVGSIFRRRPRPGLVARQIVDIGFGSQPVVIVTGAFSGAVFTAQMYYQFVKMGMETVVGGVVAIATCRELAPVLGGLMVAGRVGAAMAAEIGTMKVSQQIDALRGMAVHPVDYLVVPRFLGMMVSMPLLIAESIVFGIAASYVVAVMLFGIPATWFWTHVEQWMGLDDLVFGMIKGLVFGMGIVAVACHQGLAASHGAVGVGRATTRAVVIASLGLLVANFFLTLLLNEVLPAN